MARRASTINTELKARFAADRKRIATEIKEREARELARITTFPEGDRFEARRAIDCRDIFDLAAERTKATGAHYDPTTEHVVVELENGCTFGFPPRRHERLATQSDAFLADVAVSDGAWLVFGRNQPDVPSAQQLRVLDLMMGRLGTKKFMARKQADKPATTKPSRTKPRSALIVDVNDASIAHLH